MQQIYFDPLGNIADLVHSCQMEWLITRINVRPPYRGLGYGTALLEDILADADELGVTLFLAPSSSGGLTQHELEAWYERHGFHWESPSIMRRDPR